jgi:hypothetical protein
MKVMHKSGENVDKYKPLLHWMDLKNGTYQVSEYAAKIMLLFPGFRQHTKRLRLSFSTIVPGTASNKFQYFILRWASTKKNRS